MKLSEIGEFGFIERFRPDFESLKSGMEVGIGDDCAIIPANASEDFIVTTDLLMENIHFLKKDISARELGIKSVAVNLSDIAAMGGTPIGTFLSIAIPGDTDVEYLDGFMKGYREISTRYMTPLLGGDTTKSDSGLAINVCVIGRCPKGKAVLRSTAEVDDIICSTGVLGDAAGGLQAILYGLERTADVQYLIDRHYNPEPRLEMGRFLLEFGGVHSMMDISDGISSDLLHILDASKVGAEIEIAGLGLSPELKEVAARYGFSAVEKALSGGEDYELLFTVNPAVYDELAAAFLAQFKTPVYALGRIVKGDSRILWKNNGVEFSLEKGGFNHFK